MRCCAPRAAARGGRSPRGCPAPPPPARPRAERARGSPATPSGEQLAEALAHEVVEARRQDAVRPGELAQVHEQERALLVAGGVRAGALARQPVELPDVPLPRA